MTVSTATSFNSYAGNGSTTSFAYAFKIFQDSNLVVTLVNDTTGVETTQTLTTDYTVTGAGSDSGGSVVFGTAPALGNTVVIRRVLPVTQETNYVPNDPFPAEAHEDALDKLTMLVQQEVASSELAVQFPEGDVGSGINNILPSVTGRSDKLLKFGLDGGVEVISASDLGSAIIGANYAVDTFTGTGSTTVYTLSAAPGSKANTAIYIDGVYQAKANYSVSGSTLTFTTAPPLNSAIEIVIGDAIPAGAATTASAVSYTQGGTGAVTTNVQAKLRETVSVKDFGAVGDGVTDDTAAFNAAIAASNHVLVPAGTYKISTQIDLTGDKTIIGMPDATGFHPLVSKINFTGASGNCFSATSAEFGGITIKNLWIVGGNGSYAIRNSRPQSFFENIHMEGFDGGGIELFEAGTGSQASWSTMIKNCKWVPPVAANNYRGYQIDINGGHVTLEGCVAIRGAIGLNIDQGEAINVYRCSFNVQNSTYSSEADADTAAIRLSGPGYKKAISIRNCYIEACTHGIYAEKCESLSIEDNYLADVGFGANVAEIYLKDSNIQNVTIRNNNFADAATSKSSVEIGDGAENVVIENNLISNTGSFGIGIKKGATTYSWIKNNDITVNVSTGTQVSDTNRLVVNADYQQNGFFNHRRANLVVAHTTWTDVGPVGNNEIWQVIIIDKITPGTWHRQDTLFIDNSGTATFKNIYNVNPGYATRELQVSAGILQFRVTSTAVNTANTVTAIRLA